MSNIDLIEDLNNTLFKIGEYSDEVLKKLIYITRKGMLCKIKNTR